MMDKWGTLVGVWQSIFLLISILWQVGGQVLSVSMQSVNSYEGSSATLTCAFTISDPDYIFWDLEWYKGNDPNSDPSSVAISDFFGGATTPTFFNGYDDTSKYRISRNDAASSFEILSTSFNEDEGLYTCRVTARPSPTGTNVRVTVSAQLTIFILPTSVTLSDSTGVIAPGGTSFLVEGEDHDYTCTVPGINPGASFTWSVVGGGITPGATTNVTGSDGLITSTGMATLSPAWANHGQTLQCQARNKDGHAGATAGVMLDVKVPPKVSTMSLQDSDDNFLVGSVDVNEGIQKSFTCNAQSRPAAKMEWFLDNNSQSVIDAPTGGGNGLIDTTSDWSLTPARTNHTQVMKCEASTAQSDVNSLPSVSVILNVNGPPDNPEITGNTLMTEGVASLLTCTAQEGYPQDWSLVWYNVSSIGESEIPGATPDSPSLISDRYTFTSRLNYSPSRHDNGNSIRCTAEWNSWSPQPQVTFGPLNVQFCARYLSVTQTTKLATAGSTVTLSCETSDSSNPATTLTWSKDNVQLTTPTDQPNTPGDNGGRVTTVIYTTDVLDKTNNGDVYTCCATNPNIPPCVTPLCDAHTLNVRYRPDFTSLTQTPQTPVNEGKDVNLTCIVDANPPTVDITWNKEGDAFNPTNGVTSTLTLSNIRREDAGYYTCTANNGVPTDNPADVVSTPITVIVQYEVNITNKAMDEVGVKNGDDAVLICIAVGNPKPVMEWYGPNNTGIISDMDEGKFLITNETSGGDGVFELELTSKLTIKAVDFQVDYGVYTCISSNGIGKEDSLNITLTGTRQPDTPTRVVITEQTAKSLTVTWKPGYNGGAEQSFRVSCLKTSDKKEVFTEDTDGKTTSTATGLDDYTEYEIRVYARNSIGESIGYGNTKGYTLPDSPGPDSGITVKYNKLGGTVEVEGLNKGNGCIQLEVQYEGNTTWQKCGACIESDDTVTLSDHCASSQRRRRRAIGDIVAVQSKYCFGSTCSEPADPEIVKPTNATPLGPDIGLIVGATLGGLVLITIIVVLIVYLVRTSPKKRNSKEDSFSPADDIQDVELQEQSHDAQPEENNGITNEALQNNVYLDEDIPKKEPEKNEAPDAEPTEKDGLEADTVKGPIPVKRYTVDSGDTYAQVNKTKLPPKPQSARSAPTNLPDVTYAAVNKDKKPKPPPDDYAAKKKPKKYVPPSSRAAEESAYEEVQISDKDKAKSPPAAASADTYASVGGQQDTSGRVVTEDGLIYAEVGHMKQHPVDQPPIQTEESTEYASLDFARMKPEDK